jgi:lipoprotein-releasing system permease protein
MNGFDREIQKRIFSMVAPMTLSSETGYIADWPELQTMLKEFPYIMASAPFATGEVLLTYGGSNQPALVNGILPEQEPKVSELSQKMIRGQLSSLQAGKFGIVLGSSLANRLGVAIGDKVTVVTTQISLTPAGVIPRFKRFTVIGIFSAGNGFGFDAGLGFIHLNDAQRLLGLGNNVTGLHLNTKDVFAAPRLAHELMSQLSSSATVTTWADQFGEFFHAVKLEKTMMFFILLLILAVAAFNMVSTLVMVVSEKESDIAILRTFGATPRMIMNIFIVQGGLVGVIGTLIGVIGGVLLAWNVTAIVNGLEHLLRVQFVSSSAYLVDYLPSEIEWGDIVKISCASLFLSLVATLYPAWRASKMDPVESLRYE